MEEKEADSGGNYFDGSSKWRDLCDGKCSGI